MAYIYLPDGTRLRLTASREQVAADVLQALMGHQGLAEFTIVARSGNALAETAVTLNAHQIVAVTEQPLPIREQGVAR